MALTPSGIAATLRWPVQFCFSTSVIVYALSIVTGNVSQVDRVWTFLPVIYTGYYALLPLWPNVPAFPLAPFTPYDVNSTVASVYSSRALLMFGLQVIWMFRLSYNTWRRGLFSLTEEDYRWEIVRNKIHPILFQIFNLTFIAFTQNILLFLLAVPTHNVATQPSSQQPLGQWDVILGSLSLLVILVEFVSDNQQFSYQTFKRSGVINPNEWFGANLPWTPEDVKRGFVTRGMWSWSRHPNFFCEQSFWILQTLFPILTSGAHQTLSWDTIPSLVLQMTPAIALCSLFISSTIFTESISVPKYPVYKEYQRRVSMFIPIFTPLCGLWLSMFGEKEKVDKLVYGGEKAE